MATFPVYNDITKIPGQVPIMVNHLWAFTIENFSVQMQRASEIATGFAGNFASRDGVPQYSFNFEMPPRALVPGAFEVPLEILTGRWDWEYTLGSQVFVLVGAKVNSEDLSIAMQQGNTRCNMRGNALMRIPE